MNSTNNLAAASEPMPPPAPAEVALVARAVRHLEPALRRLASVGPPELAVASGRLIAAGGKRLRPRLVILCGLASGPGRRGLMRLALAAEAVHTATLLHDDVIDNSPTRRGVPSVPFAYGNALAVLAGDQWFATAIDLVLASEVPGALAELLRTIRSMVRAEARQLSQRASPRIDEEACLEIVAGKTASLFRWCALAGAMAAGAEPSLQVALAGFADRVGSAFQLADDLDDLGSPGCVGEDLSQGAITLPMVLACREKRELAPLVAQCVRDAALRTCDPAEAGRKVAEAVWTTRARGEVLARISRLVDRALGYLACLPDSPYRAVLAETALALARRAASPSAGA